MNASQPSPMRGIRLEAHILDAKPKPAVSNHWLHAAQRRPSNTLYDFQPFILTIDIFPVPLPASRPPA